MVEYEIKYQDRIFKSLEDFEDFVFKKTGMKAIFNPTKLKFMIAPRV